MSALSVSATITLGLLAVLVGVTMLMASATLFRWATDRQPSGPTLRKGRTLTVGFDEATDKREHG